MTFPKIQRIVTGHDENGKSIVASMGPLPVVKELEAIPGTTFHEVWNTQGSNPLIDNGADVAAGPIILPPPTNGTRIRFVDIPPDTEDFLKAGASKMHDAFSEIGDSKASTAAGDSPHPLMHRTESIDYGIVMEGELTLVLDTGEVELKPGCVVIQRGTNHAWANRSGKPCRMLFILVDGQYAPDIANKLGP
ncbi:cupin domain-containing protein [Rhizobium sp. L1K21]|uniref:cupin domain-containing protein n=1 Tax=Rhizobium sp. L1K21 TaxID=2954933 RepID=UPI002093734D|nr:cupin domain-containing protein [Rhizobium sp. L1K21]MCO6187912.1 cupin domain-containing protein [Rhizobium sp. L1K21]